MKIKWPKNLGHIVTNVSFIAFALALVVIIGGRIFAQNTTTATDEENTEYYQNAILNFNSGNSNTSGATMPTLNEDYTSSDRVTEFFEGSECEIANIDCFTKNYQSAQILGYTALTTGRGSAGTTATTADGALQGVGKIIAWTFQPQASGAYYVAEALQNIGVVSPTYAQGFGYYSLSPYLKLWRVFRNIAYIFFTVVIIVIGFMILLRQKAGGQAAVTAQQALPRIIMALILVTFSYAIAGFCIDLMYWLMYAFSSFLNFNDGSVTSANNLVNGNFGTVMQIVMWGNIGNIFDSVNTTTSGLLSNILGDGLLGKFGSWALGGLASIVGTFIILIALLSSLFRLLFILLKSYAVVLLNIIFAPLNLMMVAISGGKAFKNWIMSIIANLSPFVITFFMLVIVGTLNAFFKNATGTASLNSGPIYSEANGQASAQGFTPPYLIGVNSNNAVDAFKNLGTIVGLAIALAIPELVENIKKKLGADTGLFGQVASDATKNLKKWAPLGTKAALGTMGAVGGATVRPLLKSAKMGFASGLERKAGGGSFWEGAGHGFKGAWGADTGDWKGNVRGILRTAKQGSSSSMRKYATTGEQIGGGHFVKAAQSIFSAQEDPLALERKRYETYRKKVNQQIDFYENKGGVSVTGLKDWRSNNQDFDSFVSRGMQKPEWVGKSNFTKNMKSIITPKENQTGLDTSTSGINAGSTASSSSAINQQSRRQSR